MVLPGYAQDLTKPFGQLKSEQIFKERVIEK